MAGRAKLTLLVFSLLLGLTCAANSRLLTEYADYPEQLRRADLVVIAYPADKTKETGEKTQFGGMNEPAVVVETDFDVVLVFKGDKKAKAFCTSPFLVPEI
jgi:hypothetical protein